MVRCWSIFDIHFAISAATNNPKSYFAEKFAQPSLAKTKMLIRHHLNGPPKKFMHAIDKIHKCLEIKCLEKN